MSQKTHNTKTFTKFLPIKLNIIISTVQIGAYLSNSRHNVWCVFTHARSSKRENSECRYPCCCVSAFSISFLSVFIVGLCLTLEVGFLSLLLLLPVFALFNQHCVKTLLDLSVFFLLSFLPSSSVPPGIPGHGFVFCCHCCFPVWNVVNQPFR